VRDGENPKISQAPRGGIAKLHGRRAVAFGKHLIRKYPDFAGGYELAAQGYEELGRPRKALGVLRKGASRRAGSWRLLEALAVRYSDLRKFDKALRALERALEIAPDEPSLHYNRALVFARLNQAERTYEAVLRALELEPRFTRAALLAASVECSLGRLNDARARLEKTIEQLESRPPEEREEAALSDAYRLLAEIELAYHRRERALELFWQAIAHEKHNAAARYWVRELLGDRSPKASYWRIVVSGRGPAGNEIADSSREAEPRPLGGEKRFETLYDVVAETAEEALELVRPFEPPEVRPTLKLESAKVMKRKVAGPKGVYRTSPYRWIGAAE